MLRYRRSRALVRADLYLHSERERHSPAASLTAARGPVPPRYSTPFRRNSVATHERSWTRQCGRRSRRTRPAAGWPRIACAPRCEARAASRLADQDAVPASGRNSIPVVASEEADVLRQGQRAGGVDRVGAPAHVGPPGIRPGLPAASGFLLAAEGTADLGA